MREVKILDVRSPREFAHSHIPQALNIPVLSDEEHCEIGTLYRQDTFGAKLKGSAYICKNIAGFLEEEMIFHPKNKLILYCARGGQRSKALWSVLREIGFDCERIDGGYKAYRQGVLERLSISPSQEFFTLYGMTGCGKSELIARASEWSIDLEGLSDHYGSSFGDWANGFLGQKSNAMFENLLDQELMCKKGTVLIEGESKKMGKIVIPSKLFEAMHQGRKICLRASMEARVQRITRQYIGIKKEHFMECMQRIRPYIQRVFWNEVMDCWDRGEMEKVAEILLEKYYDRVYRQCECEFVVDADDMSRAYNEVFEIVKGSHLPSLV